MAPDVEPQAANSNAAMRMVAIDPSRCRCLVVATFPLMPFNLRDSRCLNFDVSSTHS
jgi:hypothetical protein